jgi:DNA uptake protein ComE-like DNA-binding protein
MARSSDPLHGLGGPVVRNVTSRLVAKLVAVAVAALLGMVGLKQCGQPSSREQAAQRATASVDVNSASLDEPMTLPRISEGLARKIIAGRPYPRVEDLEKVSGIGPKTMEGIRARATVGSGAQPTP